MPVPCSPTSLVEFSYASKAILRLPPAALARLERQCWAHNIRAGLTGELRYARGRFKQTLEGPWAEIMTLASRILTDPRHTEISIRAFRPIQSRRFAHWTARGLAHRTAPAIVPIPAGNVCWLPVGDARLSPAAAAKAAGSARSRG